MEDFAMTSHVIVESAFHTTRTATQKESRTASISRPKVGEGIPGEHLIGLAFAVVALMGGGWFFWTLARALETYRVY
jgi:hypothetical protein